MSKFDSPQFAAWKRQRAEKAAADVDYQRYVSAMTGQEAERRAGVAHEQIDGGRRVPETLSDDQAYAHYMSVLDGTAARRQAEEDVRQSRRDRAEEWNRHARETGTPPRQQYAD